MAPTFVLAVVLSFTAILVFAHVLWLIADGRRRHLPPGPWPLPVIGNLHAVKLSGAHRSLARLAERHGPLMCIWAGRSPVVVVSTPEAASKILKNPDLVGRTVLDAWRAEGHADNSVIFLQPGEKWRAMRRFARSELLTKPRLDARQQLRQEKTRELLRYVSERAARGEAVGVGEAVFVSAVNVVSQTLFSVDIGSREVQGMVTEWWRLVATPTVSDILPSTARADIQGARRRMSALVRRIYGLVDEQFTRRRRDRERGEPGKGDVMDVVIEKEKEWEAAGGHMDYDAAKGLFADLIAAGTDTISSAVEWAMAELLQCPESMKMATDELKMVIGTKRQVEESDISQLPYLQAVVKETLRLHPVVPIQLLRAMVTVQIEGYTIPKRTNILINIWAINRQSKMWVDPNKFMPGRFIGKDISFSGKDFEFMPFSAGRRVCLGMPLAYRMLHLILGSLLYHFDWTLPANVKDNAIDMTEKFGAVVSMATPLKAIAKKCDE
ncbi:unnamed protein product [Urochloa decumbens]|uniref:Cytochrome P450 n=1 Tax=Urochloa decumbens TaxID=240449 RepID=A0ABC8ZYK2_9POAL